MKGCVASSGVGYGVDDIEGDGGMETLGICEI
jgi:hypothetical protein